jgi:hypothetical protein
MARDAADPDSGRAAKPPRRTAARFFDADGLPTDDPAAAVGGEIVEYGDHGRLRRRTSFFLASRDMPRRIPVGEPAFLLWVLAGLMLVWIVIGLVLHFA